MSTTDLLDLFGFAPVPRSALGPAVNEQGYYVDRVERNPYRVTDGTYQSAFLTTSVNSGSSALAARRLSRSALEG